ncbi:MAG: hypothetical protein ACKVOQ_10040 [Cyclobacteriaceae bacterium]
MKKLLTIVVVGHLLFLASCKKDDPPATPTMLTTRTYRMGFQNSAPRFGDFNLFVQSLTIWTTRADAAIISIEVPWDSLYAGKSVKQYVLNNYKGLVDVYRSKNFKLWVYIDPQNGLNRGSDATGLVALGKSIAQDDAQKLYRRFAVVMDSILRPEHLGLALETNLMRAASSASLYNGIKKAVNDAAADVRAIDKNVKLSVSAQADFAWGRLLGNGVYVGIAQDFIDFPFIEEVGISSYPYFGFAKPEDIPLDYYSKLTEGKSLPVFVCEGGWPSQSFTITGANQKTITSDVTVQQNYFTRQSQLLDNAKAIGFFQLVVTDIDATSLPPNVDPNINNFIYLGVLDVNLKPKPSLTIWDGLFKRAFQ